MEIEEIKKVLQADFDNKKVSPAIRERMKIRSGIDWCASFILRLVNEEKLSFGGAYGQLESVLTEMGYGNI